MEQGFPGLGKQEFVILMGAHALGQMNATRTGYKLPGFDMNQWNGASGQLVDSIYIRRLGTSDWFGYYDPVEKTTSFGIQEDDGSIHTTAEICKNYKNVDRYCFKRTYMSLPLDLALRKNLMKDEAGRIYGMKNGQWIDLSNADVGSRQIDDNPDTVGFFDRYGILNGQGEGTHNAGYMNFINDFYQVYAKMLRNGYQGDFGSGSTKPLITQTFEEQTSIRNFCEKSFNSIYHKGSICKYYANEPTCNNDILLQIIGAENYQVDNLLQCIERWA